MHKTQLKFLVATLLLLGLLALAAPGQPERVYERYVRNAEIDLAIAQARDPGYLAEALATFARIGAQNPGTTLGAVALLQQAKYSAPADARPIYQAIIRGYPRSSFELEARYRLDRP